MNQTMDPKFGIQNDVLSAVLTTQSIHVKGLQSAPGAEWSGREGLFVRRARHNANNTIGYHLVNPYWNNRLVLTRIKLVGALPPDNKKMLEELYC
jgi:hypothetical protein